MRLLSLAFAGYRSFAARSPAAPERPLQRVDLAPLTILLGKNNSGKSNAARLLHHVLLALGQTGENPFPLTHGTQRYASNFRELQYNGAFFNPLDIEVELSTELGRVTFAAQLVQPDDAAEERQPVVQNRRLNGIPFPDDKSRLGLWPNTDGVDTLRESARRLLEASCSLGPVRDPIEPSYEVRDESQHRAPTSNEEVAQLLRADAELRAAVAEWTAEHLEGWRIDRSQSLDVFKLLARRPGRESNLAAAGQGIQQVLPVVALCCWRKLGRGPRPFLDVIEQPELHLHDAAHAPLGDLLLSAVAGGGGNIVVETHSESLVLRVRRRIAEGSLSPNQVSLLYVKDSEEGSQIQRIGLHDNGEVEWWPEGVFSEAFVEVKAIRRAQRRQEQG